VLFRRVTPPEDGQWKKGVDEPSLALEQFSVDNFPRVQFPRGERRTRKTPAGTGSRAFPGSSWKKPATSGT